MLEINKTYLGDCLELMKDIDDKGIDMILCDLVLDNCAGSGTTGLACRNTNRNYIMMEKEEKYFNIINERLK